MNDMYTIKLYWKVFLLWLKWLGFFGFSTSYSKEWDLICRNIVDQKIPIVEKDMYTVEFESGHCIWISNKWYGWGQEYHDYRRAIYYNKRPSLKTMILLDHYIKSQREVK